MNITIKEHNKPEFKVCKMTCDSKLDESGMLDQYEITKILNGNTTNLFIGRPQSGKSALLHSLFSNGKNHIGDKFRIYRKRFENIFYFCPSQSMASMGKNNIFDKLPDEKKYCDLDAETLEMVVDYIKSEPKEHKNCLIIDDMASHLKDNNTQKILKELFMNKRHMSLTIIITSQTWFSVPKEIRRLFDNLWCFKVSKNEMHNIMHEIVETKEKYADDIAKTIFNEKYKFMFININTQRIFDGWNGELIFPDD